MYLYGYKQQTGFEFVSCCLMYLQLMQDIYFLRAAYRTRKFSSYIYDKVSDVVVDIYIRVHTY